MRILRNELEKIGFKPVIVWVKVWSIIFSEEDKLFRNIYLNQPKFLSNWKVDLASISTDGYNKWHLNYWTKIAESDYSDFRLSLSIWDVTRVVPEFGDPPSTLVDVNQCRVLAFSDIEKAQRNCFPGRLYAALEALMPEISIGKMGVVGRNLTLVYSAEERQKAEYNTSRTLFGTGARWAQEEPWKNLPDIPVWKVNEVKASIMYCSPRNNKSANEAIKEILDLLKEDYKRVFWETLNCFKLLSVIHSIPHNWK
jgi:hypothetical protein